jgi:protein-tyrosine phosphatase
MHILFVDAGNYCRSPAAETVLRTLAARAGKTQITVGSAGLKDKHEGDTADPRTIEACAARGYSLEGFRCREITAEDFAKAALILAMDAENLAALEARRPSGVAVPIRLLLGAEDVPDPYFGGAEGFVAMMDQIERGARHLLATLP